MSHEAGSWEGIAVIGVLIFFLIGIAYFVPQNGITGNAVAEKTCGKLGCTELCDAEAENTCSQKGTVCCPTHWESGVCDYSVNCEKIREYSLYQNLETYQDTVREAPEPVEATWRRFFFPLLLTACIIGYFVWERGKEPIHR